MGQEGASSILGSPGAHTITMSEYTERWKQAAEEARRAFHAGQTCSLWGKNPSPPRGPVKLLDLNDTWYAVFSSHLLTNAAGNTERLRTLDFFIGERDSLTEELSQEISSVVFDGNRYSLLTEARHEVRDPRYWRIICAPNGEKVT
jgi:hypothetical protein